MNEKLVEIKQNLDSAYFKMKEILELEALCPLSRQILLEKREGLKNMLEEIRVSIEELLSKYNSMILSEIFQGLLGRLLRISEQLRISYAFPGYQESYYIMDTLKSVDERR